MELEIKLSIVKSKLIARKYQENMIDDAIQSACVYAMEKEMDLDALSISWYYKVAQHILIDNIRREKRYVSLDDFIRSII